MVHYKEKTTFLIGSGLFFILLLRVTFIEAIDATVNLVEAIFTGEEWMTIGTCVDPYFV
jgi:hypothetical protein